MSVAPLVDDVSDAPFAIRDGYGDLPGGLWPWASESPAAQAGEIEVLPSAEIHFEQIAGLQPDVIFAIGSGIEQPDFDRLSAIAPTVAQSDEYNTFGTPWDVAQVMIGRALSLEAEAQALVDDVEAQIDAVVAEHPTWQGRTGTVAIVNADGTSGAFTDGDNRGHMLSQLGFAIPAEISSTLSIPYALDALVPQIDEALAGAR